jgi:hypothetical protein
VSKRNAEFRYQQKRVNRRKVQQAPHPAITRLGTNAADRAAICSAIHAARRRIRAGRSRAIEGCDERSFSCNGALLGQRRSDVMAGETAIGEVEMERAILAGTKVPAAILRRSGSIKGRPFLIRRDFSGRSSFGFRAATRGARGP